MCLVSFNSWSLRCFVVGNSNTDFIGIPESPLTILNSPTSMRSAVQAVLYIVHCNKVSKPVKGKYLLLCMNSVMYLPLTWYTLIMFLKVLSHLILKITSFVKYFKKRVLKYFKIFMKFLNISKWNISSCISTVIHRIRTTTCHTRLYPPKWRP